MTVADLETARQQAAQRVGKLRQPMEAISAAEQELLDIDEQIAAARQLDQEAHRADMQRAGEIASAWHAYNSVTAELRDALRSIHAARLRLVAYGVADPGDRIVSAEAIGALLIERDRP
jgi:hypothetical protein